MMIGHRIGRFEDTRKFKRRLAACQGNKIECTAHTLFRLSENQREIFNCNSLKTLLLEANPVCAGTQYNGAYSAFYKHKKERFIRVVLDIKPDKIKIITFYIIEKYQMPKL